LAAAGGGGGAFFVFDADAARVGVGAAVLRAGFRGFSEFLAFIAQTCGGRVKTYDGSIWRSNGPRANGKIAQMNFADVKLDLPGAGT
jgi:hypothetical protein